MQLSMKNHLCLLLLLVFNLSFCQEKSLFILIDDDVHMERGEAPLKGVYEFNLSIQNTNSKNIDYFKFVINCNGNKSFEENGVDFKTNKDSILTIDDLKKMSFCDIHELLSNATYVYVVKKDKTKNTFKKWLTGYYGTVRNKIISKLGY